MAQDLLRDRGQQAHLSACPEQLSSLPLGYISASQIFCKLLAHATVLNSCRHHCGGFTLGQEATLCCHTVNLALGHTLKGFVHISKSNTRYSLITEITRSADTLDTVGGKSGIFFRKIESIKK